MKTNLSIKQARRLALAAQGLSAPRRDRAVTGRENARAISTMQLLQIDSVNVLIRSHYLPLFSRLGAYDRALLDERTFGTQKRRTFEYWAHEASFLPLACYPLLRWKMERARRGAGNYTSIETWARDNAAYVEEVRRELRDKGPITVSDLADPGGRTGQWWGWNKGKFALEHLFDIGEAATATRQGGFERIYDLAERVIPPAQFNTPAVAEADAIRALLDLSAQALGVATEIDLRDYFRLPVAETKTAIAELVEAGRLLIVSVESWNNPAYLHCDAALPRKAGASALFSPFDPLVWHRPRTERLFGFRYRLEIYTPQPKRLHGYYVLPFLHGDSFAARVCLKADRQEGVLRVNATHLEDGAAEAETAGALAGELKRMAAWLGLDRVAVQPAGSLHQPLHQALTAA